MTHSNPGPWCLLNHDHLWRSECDHSGHSGTTCCGPDPEPISNDPACEMTDTAYEAAAARKRFSEAFLLHKNSDPRKPLTDREAEHRAYIDCGVQRDMAEARLEVARSRLTATR